ncbi:paar motif family [Acinetobacter baumannii]|nr:Uncharacterised protein [Acinetobacter baumannii]SSO29308.1 paar motif family [Acinetobacter baumannii]SSP07516.1 paar motif family [Acinetobacter baumannii]
MTSICNNKLHHTTSGVQVISVNNMVLINGIPFAGISDKATYPTHEIFEMIISADL